jgi:hypothetical protein
MSIVSSTYEMDAGRHVVERHTDSDGKQYMQTYFAPAAWGTTEIEAKLAEHATQISESLAEGEADQILGEG